MEDVREEKGNVEDKRIKMFRKFARNSNVEKHTEEHVREANVITKYV